MWHSVVGSPQSAGLAIDVHDPFTSTPKARRYGLTYTGKPCGPNSDGRCACRDGARKVSVYYDRSGFSLQSNWDLAYLRSAVDLFSENYPEIVHRVYVSSRRKRVTSCGFCRCACLTELSSGERTTSFGASAERIR